MTKSALATIDVPAYAGNYTKGRRGYEIKKVTVHHMAGVMSAEDCGRIFQRQGRNGSAHYGIGNDGKIASYVGEENIAWTDSNWDSNATSVTIETSNSAIGAGWPVSDNALSSLIKLVADIAKRNGIGSLVPGKTLTWHRMYASTSCPGEYLLSKMQYIADEANKINNAPAPAPTPAPAPVAGFKVGDRVTLKDYVSYDGVRLLKTRDFYYISGLQGKRAVLRADNTGGSVYAAVSTDNLTVVGGSSPAPATGINVGDRVLPNNFVDYNGTQLVRTRDFYYVSEASGDRCVLRADSVNGPVYAAVKKSNLRKV